MQVLIEAAHTNELCTKAIMNYSEVNLEKAAQGKHFRRSHPFSAYTRAPEALRATLKGKVHETPL